MHCFGMERWSSNIFTVVNTPKILIKSPNLTYGKICSIVRKRYGILCNIFRWDDMKLKDYQQLVKCWNVEKCKWLKSLTSILAKLQGASRKMSVNFNLVNRREALKIVCPFYKTKFKILFVVLSFVFLIYAECTWQYYLN